MRTSQRRHDDDKVLRRRLSSPSHWWVERDERIDDATRARWRGITRNTGTRCSCWLCRIARRYYGASVQERRQVAYMEAYQ